MRYQHLRYPGGRYKAVTFSYDDGCPQDIKFSNVLSSYGIKCTFNLNSDELRGKAALTKEQIVENFLDKGHEIAVHGYFHRAEGMMRPIEGIRDVLDCRIELENKYGMIIRGMAYPDTGIRTISRDTDYGKIKNYLSDLGIVYCRALGGDNAAFRLPTDWHAWMPTAHHENPELFNFIDKFLGTSFDDKTYMPTKYPRLFYLWGHSYEFDRNNNWDRLDKICEKLSGKEDIWYATNIEIYEYVTAYESLIYSADGKRVYNPTLHEIWLERDKTVYSIASGKTVVFED